MGGWYKGCETEAFATVGLAYGGSGRCSDAPEDADRGDPMSAASKCSLRGAEKVPLNCLTLVPKGTVHLFGLK